MKMAKKKLYTQPIGLLVSNDVHRKLLDLCDQQELSISEWIREAIEEKLDHEQECLTNITKIE